MASHTVPATAVVLPINITNAGVDPIGPPATVSFKIGHLGLLLGVGARAVEHLQGGHPLVDLVPSPGIDIGMEGGGKVHGPAALAGAIHPGKPGMYKVPVVVRGHRHVSGGDALQIVDATAGIGRLRAAFDKREGQRRKEENDRDDDKKFNEREAPMFVIHRAEWVQGIRV